MVEAGHVASEQEAFDRYLGSGKPGAIPRPNPDPRRAIRLVRAAGGVAALAHPVFHQDAGWQQRLASTPQRLDRLQAAGLQAVECFYPDATPDITAQLLAWTRERGLLAIGGTDYHGPDKAPFAQLGTVSVDEDVLTALRAYRTGDV
jgi:predicted metal-dependent phosphoesterase TrpH